ncbi:hypothetical protein HA402_009199 [Bradysia odoriphaga]|nr:hypothetical protein HA402_009199 [Bradysia odoriphaga]
MSGRLPLFDGTQSTFRTVKLRGNRENCDVCSANPIQPIDYEQFCGMKASDKDFHLNVLDRCDRITVEHYRTIIDE